jgi:uncharacterized protein (TIGR02246 family)
MQTSTLPTRADGDRGVRDALSDLFTAWEENDAEAFASLYTDDASVILPGRYLKNRDELRSTMLAAFAGPLRGSTRAVDLDTVRLLGPDAAVVAGRSVVVPEGEERPPSDRWSSSTWVLTRRQDHWLIAAYHEAPAFVGEVS